MHARALPKWEALEGNGARNIQASLAQLVEHAYKTYGRGFNPHKGLAIELGKLIRSALGLIHILHLLSLDAATPRA